MPKFSPSHTPSIAFGFFKGYIEAAEWLLDEEDEDASGWSEQAIEEACEDCAMFEEANQADLNLYYEISGRDEESAGVDFWLSRNGHGAGFFDRGNEPVFDRLQEAARVWGSREAYVGDDGLLYFA